MDEAERLLFVRLERERSLELHREHRERHERRARALERPEARAEWDRLAAEEVERDASRRTTPEDWLHFIGYLALRDRESEELPPDAEKLRTIRDLLLAANAERPEHLIALLKVDDQAIENLADALWLDEHGLWDKS